MIGEFYINMKNVELNRQKLIESELSRLIQRLVDIGFQTRIEIERSLESCAKEVNVEILRNRASYSELNLMLKVEEVKFKARFKSQWENRTVDWKRLRHERVLKLCKEELQKSKWTNPCARRAVLDDLIQKQKSVKDQATLEMNKLFKLVPPFAHIQTIKSSIAVLRVGSAKYLQETLENWKKFQTIFEENCKEMLRNVVEDLAVYAHKTEEEIKQETASEVEPILDDLKKKDSKLFSDVEHVLNGEDHRFFVKCSNIIAFYFKAEKLWMSYYMGVEDLERKIDTQLEDDTIKVKRIIDHLEANMTAKVVQLSSASSVEKLEEIWSQVSEILAPKQKLENSYREHNSKMIEVASSHETLFADVVKNFEKKFANFTGLISKHPPDENAEKLEPLEEKFLTASGTEYAVIETAKTMSDIVCDKEEEKVADAEEDEEPVEDTEKINNVQDDAEDKTHWNEIKDGEDGVCFEYLEFEREPFVIAIMHLRSQLLEALEEVERSELERTRKECELRIELYSDDLDIQLRKLRPRYPLCRTTEKTIRSDQLNANVERYERHKRRCDSLLNQTETRFEKTTAICNEKMDEREEHEEVCYKKLPECETQIDCFKIMRQKKKQRG